MSSSKKILRTNSSFFYKIIEPYTIMPIFVTIDILDSEVFAAEDRSGSIPKL